MFEDSGNSRKRHVFVVSDATGGTCEMVVQAALSQFKTTEVILDALDEIVINDVAGIKLVWEESSLHRLEEIGHTYFQQK